MIIPVIKVSTRITEVTTDGRTAFQMDMFITDVLSYNTDTGLEGDPYPQIPQELFLYVKYSNTDKLSEPVHTSLFVRVIAPEDLDSNNPVLIGTEQLLWGKKHSPRQSLPMSTLLPAVADSGSPLSKVNLNRAVAPDKTFSKSGYYKSRVFSFRSYNASEIQKKRKDMLTMLDVFKKKYLAKIDEVVLSPEFNVTETNIID